MKTLLSTLLILFTTCLSQAGFAAAKIEGYFTANQNCPAYVSKNKQTNPDETHLKPGNRYRLIEANKANQPSWFRIIVEDATPKKRWVSKSCGTIKLDSTQRTFDQCSTPDLADSYKLALTWQPAFCETNRHKAECKVANSDAYEASNFTLHGLWPNKSSCGHNYSYCGHYTKENHPKKHCDYKPVPFSADALNTLKEYMPSAEHGSCLQRHEWYKHGTCQTQWSAGQYYELAIKLTKTINASAVASLMRNNIGKRVKTKDLFIAIDQSFGENTHQRATLKCKRGNLVEIRFNLPKTISGDSDLSQLLQSANKGFSNGCGKSFKVDKIGFGNLF